MRTLKFLDKIAEFPIENGKYTWKMWIVKINRLNKLEKEYVLAKCEYRLKQYNMMRDQKIDHWRLATEKKKNVKKS